MRAAAAKQAAINLQWAMGDQDPSQAAINLQWVIMRFEKDAFQDRMGDQKIRERSIPRPHGVATACLKLEKVAHFSSFYLGISSQATIDKQ